MTARVRLLAAAAAGWLLLFGCSSEDRVAETEDGIAAVLGERLGQAVGVVSVSCPDDAPLDTGDTLSCDVTIGEAPPQAVAFDIAEEGEVSLASAVIPVGAVEAYLVAELSVPAEGVVVVDCGDDALLVAAVGGTFACRVVRSADGVAFDVTVEVRSLDGSVTYTVATTSTTSTTLTTTPAS